MCSVIYYCTIHCMPRHLRLRVFFEYASAFVSSCPLFFGYIKTCVRVSIASSQNATTAGCFILQRRGPSPSPKMVVGCRCFCAASLSAVFVDVITRRLVLLTLAIRRDQSRHFQGSPSVAAPLSAHSESYLTFSRQRSSS